MIYKDATFQRFFEIDLSGHPSGVYFFLIENQANSNKLSGQLIVQK